MRAGEDEREAVGRKGHAYLTTGRVGVGSKSAGALGPGYSGVAGGLPLGVAAVLTAPSALGQLRHSTRCSPLSGSSSVFS